MTSNMAIRIEALQYRWPDSTHTLQLPALDIPAGRQVFLHGPSGCGKSTLLTLLAGLARPQSGKLALFGEPMPERLRQRDRLRADRLGIIFQQFNLLPYLHALDNVLLACRLSPRRRAAAGPSPREKAQTLLAALDIPKRLWYSLPEQLSIGQQQRVAAARALIGCPDLILADEPTSALDSRNRDRFMDLLQDQARQQQMTLLLVSHDLSLAARFEQTLSLPELCEVTSA